MVNLFLRDPSNDEILSFLMVVLFCSPESKAVNPLLPIFTDTRESYCTSMAVTTSASWMVPYSPRGLPSNTIFVMYETERK